MRLCSGINALALATFVSNSCLSQDVPKFQHSPDAHVLAEQYAQAVVVERERTTAMITEIEASLDNKLKELRDTLVSELSKLQDSETKAGKLDTAVEIRDAIREILRAKRRPITPMELRAKLSDSVWNLGPSPSVSLRNNWIRLNSDGTVTTGWHKEPSMWAILPDGSLQMICTGNRSIIRWTINDELNLARNFDSNESNWHAKRK